MKIVTSIFKFIIIVAVCIPGKAYGLINFRDGVFSELATSGRALALGNAYIAKVDDATSAFYNPAGLGSVRYSHFHFSNLHKPNEKCKKWMKCVHKLVLVRLSCNDDMYIFMSMTLLNLIYKYIMLLL